MNTNPELSPRLIYNAIYSFALVVVSRPIDNVFNLISPAGLHTLMQITSFVWYFFPPHACLSLIYGCRINVI